MPNYFGMFGPSEAEIEAAIRSERRLVAYRWGTLLVRRNGWYFGVAWKVAVVGVLIFGALIVVLYFVAGYP